MCNSHRDSSIPESTSRLWCLAVAIQRAEHLSGKISRLSLVPSILVCSYVKVDGRICVIGEEAKEIVQLGLAQRLPYPSTRRETIALLITISAFSDYRIRLKRTL